MSCAAAVALKSGSKKSRKAFGSIENFQKLCGFHLEKKREPWLCEKHRNAAFLCFSQPLIFVILKILPLSSPFVPQPSFTLSFSFPPSRPSNSSRLQIYTNPSLLPLADPSQNCKLYSSPRVSSNGLLNSSPRLLLRLFCCCQKMEFQFLKL